MNIFYGLEANNACVAVKTTVGCATSAVDDTIMAQIGTAITEAVRANFFIYTLLTVYGLILL